MSDVSEEYSDPPFSIGTLFRLWHTIDPTVGIGKTSESTPIFALGSGGVLPDSRSTNTMEVWNKGTALDNLWSQRNKRTALDNVWPHSWY